MNAQSTVGILLAAGFGRRFDASGKRNKLVQLLADGNRVAEQSARSMLSVLPNVVAVVRNEELVAPLQQLGCQALIFSEAERGMGASLAHAVTYVDTHFTNVHSVLIGLADMPYIQSDTVRLIVDQLQQLEHGAGIVQPVYQQQVGHPVGFTRSYFAAIMALTGDAGARHLLREFPVVQFAVNDPGVIQDIDYSSDLD